MTTVTLTEAAAQLGISERQLARWLRQKPPRLRRVLVGRPKPGWRIPQSEVDRLLREREAK